MDATGSTILIQGDWCAAAVGDRFVMRQAIVHRCAGNVLLLRPEMERVYVMLPPSLKKA